MITAPIDHGTARINHAATLLAIALAVATAALPDASVAESIDAGKELALRREAAYRFALGKLHAERGEFDEALEAYTQSIELEPRDPYTRLEVAKFHSYLAQIARGRPTQLKHLGAAAEAAAGALELAPDNADVLRSYGQIHLYLADSEPGAGDKARQAFEKLRQTEEGDLQVLSSLAQLYLGSDEAELAVDVLREAMTYRPNHRMLQALLVDALVSAGDLSSAEEILSRQLSHDPDNLEHRLRIVELRSRRGDHAGAVGLLEEVATDAVDPRVRRWLARELHLAGRSGEALSLLDRLIAAQPGRAGLRRLRVAALSALARYDEAIEELRGVLRRDPDGVGLRDHVQLSRLLERTGRSEEAIERLRSALTQSAGEERQALRLALVGVLERDGRIREAVRLLEGALAEEELEASIHTAQALSGLLQRADRVAEALKLLDPLIERLEAVELDEAAAGVRLQRLGLLAASEDWKRLSRLAQGEIEHPDRQLAAAARSLYARSLAEQGQVDEGLAALAEAPVIETSDRLRVAAQRAEILFSAGRPEEAHQLLAELIAAQGMEGRLVAARVYQAQEMYGDVALLAEELLAEDPTSTTALFLLGSAQERVGRREEAAATFDRLLQQVPDHAPTLNYLGYMWAEQGQRLEEALRLVQRAVAIDPDNGAYVDSLGWAYFQLGRYQEARDHLEWAARLIPDDGVIYEHLGDLFVQLSMPARARRYYEQAVELSGENAAAVRTKLERLKSQDL